jgi:serine kinase of HPr protein (carbohydrate metabolism regulator)
MADGMLIHASSVARDGEAVLLLGPPGSGKSDLVLRLIHEGWQLVADDQVAVTTVAGRLQAAAPAALRGLLEVRGLGILRDQAVAAPAPLRLAVRLVPRADVPRLPAPEAIAFEGISLPVLRLDPFEASATAKLATALAVTLGRATLEAGAFR